MLSDAHRDSMAAYADYFESQRRRALRLAYVMCGDQSEAEDVVAESFARMYPAWQKGQVQDPGVYLRRTIANQIRAAGATRTWSAATRRGSRSCGRRTRPWPTTRSPPATP